jgi:hypothetical protein
MHLGRTGHGLGATKRLLKFKIIRTTVLLHTR